MDKTASPENVTKQYEKMIMKICHEAEKKYGRDFDELYSEGIFSVLSKIKKWNPKKGSLCTYVYLCAFYGVWKYCNKSSHEILTEIDNPIITEKEEKPNWFKNFLEEISEETKQLVKIIFESPEELYHTVKPNWPRISKKAIYRYMIDSQDWTTEQVERSFAEIRTCL